MNQKIFFKWWILPQLLLISICSILALSFDSYYPLLIENIVVYVMLGIQLYDCRYPLECLKEKK